MKKRQQNLLSLAPLGHQTALLGSAGLCYESPFIYPVHRDASIPRPRHVCLPPGMLRGQESLPVVAIGCLSTTGCWPPGRSFFMHSIKFLECRTLRSFVIAVPDCLLLGGQSGPLVGNLSQHIYSMYSSCVVFLFPWAGLWFTSMDSTLDCPGYLTNLRPWSPQG